MQIDQISKKHLKIGVGVFALVAMTIGLSVGLTERAAANKSISASKATEGISFDVVNDCPAAKSAKDAKGAKDAKSVKSAKTDKANKGSKSCPPSILENICDSRESTLIDQSGKTGKSGGGDVGAENLASGKTGKSGGGDSLVENVASGKTGKSGGGDSLVENVASGKTGKSGGGDSLVENVASGAPSICVNLVEGISTYPPSTGEPGTGEPTLSQEELFTNPPSSGSTPTVSTEVTGPPTKAARVPVV